MSAKLLQVNFCLAVTAGEYEQAVAPLADEFAQVAGLRWKIWIANPEAREAGGILLFEDVESLDRFLSSALAATVRHHPAVRDLSAKVFDLMEGPTAVTHGPVELAGRR